MKSEFSLKDTSAAAREEAIRQHCEGRRFPEAASVAIQQYGPELLRFAVALVRSTSEADDVFAEACERIWLNLPEFRFESSFRTWAYTIVKRLCFDRLRSPGARRCRSLSAAGPLSQIQEQVRTQTASFLHSEVKDKLEQIRATLSPEDQALLSLRIDRDLSWSEIADVMGESGSLAPEARKGQEAALRKRFERLKDRLRQLAAKQGLLDR